MATVRFTIYDPQTGDIRCRGVCAEELVEQHKANKPGCEVLLGEHGSILEDKVIVPAKGSPYIRRRTEADIEARRPKVPEPAATVEQLMKVLADKHDIVITKEDLAEAAVAASTAEAATEAKPA